ncbi:hypothetical protein BOX15_Mlig010082g1, partial [Macrostomum lignano]
LLPHTGRSSALPVRFRRRLSGGNSETFWRRLLVRMLFPPSSTSVDSTSASAANDGLLTIWHRDSGPDIRFAWEVLLPDIDGSQDCRLEFCNSPLPYPIRDRRQLEALVTSGIVPASELRLTSAYLSRNRAHVSWFSSLSSLNRLQSLSLIGCAFSSGDLLVRYLAAAPDSLEELHLCGVECLTASRIRSLACMQQLRLLRLTRLLAVEPEELAALSMEMAERMPNTKVVCDLGRGLRC